MQKIAQRLSFYKHATEAHFPAMNAHEHAYWMREADRIMLMVMEELEPVKRAEHNWLQRLVIRLFRIQLTG